MASKHNEIASNSDSPTSLAYAVSSQMSLYERKHDEALSQAKKAVAIDPNSITSCFALARVLIMSGRPADALAHIEKILWLDPLNPARANVEFALAHFCLGDIERAHEYIEKAEKQNQNIGCDIRAAVYSLRGMLDETAAAYKQCQPPYWNDIFKIMLNYPFKEKGLADKFAYGLYLAKVPGEPSNYYKIYDEFRLDNHEISRLVVNRKLRAFVSFEVWLLEFFKTVSAPVT